MADDIQGWLKVSDIVIAGCTLAGPVLAVQAQKFVERLREKSSRRLQIFRALMATRDINLSTAHVEALKAVPIDFYGDRSVMDAWEEYFEHLSSKDALDGIWGQKRLDLFTRLLVKIGERVGYRFNVAEMNRIYFPKAHSTIEEEWNDIRKGAAALFKNGAFRVIIETGEASQK